MFVEVETLAARIDDVLALDPDTVDDDALHALVVDVHRQCHQLSAARARLLDVWDRRRVWESDGSRSAGHRLSRETSTSVTAAKREIARARALRAMPATAVALADGALSPEHVDLLAAANDGAGTTRFADHEQLLVEQCEQLRYADAAKVVTYWCQRADAAGAEHDAATFVEQRGASASTTFDGTVEVRATFDPVAGAAFVEELNRLVEQLRLADLAAGTKRTARQRRADARVEMAIRCRTATEGGLRPRPLITILVGEATFAHVCELAAGTVIAPGQIVPLLSDPEIERVVFDGPNRVISVSHKRRFTGAVRRAIEVRDRHCTHPSGCDEPATPLRHRPRHPAQPRRRDQRTQRPPALLAPQRHRPPPQRRTTCTTRQRRRTRHPSTTRRRLITIALMSAATRGSNVSGGWNEPVDDHADRALSSVSTERRRSTVHLSGRCRGRR